MVKPAAKTTTTDAAAVRAAVDSASTAAAAEEAAAQAAAAEAATGAASGAVAPALTALAVRTTAAAGGGSRVDAVGPLHGGGGDAFTKILLTENVGGTRRKRKTTGTQKWRGKLVGVRRRRLWQLPRPSPLLFRQ